jgi:hypothetical protein
MPKKQTNQKETAKSLFNKYHQLFKFLNTLWGVMKKNTFKVNITNHKAIQDVRLTNQQKPIKEIGINNLDKVTAAFDKGNQKLEEAIKKQTTKVDVNSDKSATKKDIVNKLHKLGELISVNKMSPEVIKAIEALGKDIRAIDLNTDLEPLEEQIGGLYEVLKGFEYFTKYDRVKVELDEKSRKALGKSLVTAVSSGGGPKDLKVNGRLVTEDNPVPVDITDAEVVVNLKEATDIEGGGKISVGTTAVEVTFTGVTQSIIITADADNDGKLFVGESNVASDGSNAITFLDAGDWIQLDYNDVTNGVYVVSDTASQNFWKGALL